MGYIKRYIQSLIASVFRKYRFKKFRVSEYQKKSSTLFILGTGNSVNDITKEDFEKIKNYDSFSINFFILHEFLTDIYMFEYIRDTERMLLWIETMREKIKRDMFRYILTSNLTLEKLKLPQYYPMRKFVYGRLKDNLAYYYVMLASCRTVKSLKYLNLFHRILPANIMLHVRGSLSVALNFAIRRKFKNIVLCGIDLDDAGNFFEFSDSFQVSTGVHKTSLPIGGLSPIDEYVKFVVRHYVDIKFYVWSPKSKLSKVIEVFNWNKL